MTAHVAQVCVFLKIMSFQIISLHVLFTNLFSDTTFRIVYTTDWNQKNPRATPPWGGLYGHLANPNPDTGYEPKFCIDVSDEHTPVNFSYINRSHINRNFPHEYDATTATTEDLESLRHSGASSSSKHTASAVRVPTVSKLGSLGNSFWKQLATYELVDSRTMREFFFADMDTEPVVSTLDLKSKGKRDRDQNVVQSLRYW